jgi:polyhydroxyalkanoate synthesis regulator phasin
MKYGRVNYPTPDVKPALAILDSLVEKGKITPEEARQRRDLLIKNRLMFIARTNGAQTPKSKGRAAEKRREHSIEEWRTNIMDEKMEDIRQRLEREIKDNEETAADEPTT